jgi:hypothetical protein
MEKLNLPAYSFQITKSATADLLIFDPLRKKKVLLTPEEWVRQNIIHFLIEEKKFPESLISLEAGIKVNRQSRRYDALIYSRSGTPLVLVECKAASVAILQDTFDQVTAYNRTVKANYLLITNGIKHYFCKINMETKRYEFLDDIPVFDEL